MTADHIPADAHLLALADKWEAAIQVAYNDYSYGQRCAFEQAAQELRELIEPAEPEREPPDPDNGWQPIATAPKDGTSILGWCVHKADKYVEDEVKWILTLYGAHAEGRAHVEDGPHVVEWGGGFDDRTFEEPNGGWLPNWWFRSGPDFEQTANPTHWMPIPRAPK